MKEDLRYLEWMMRETEVDVHPSAQQLADFAEGRLAKEERASVVEHLLICETCCRDIAAVQRFSNSTGKIWLRKPDKKTIRMILGLAASFILLLFFVSPRPEALGMIDMASIGGNLGYKSPQIGKKTKKQINADLYLEKIVLATDMTGIPYYSQALAMEKEGKYAVARKLYKQAFLAIRKLPEQKRRLGVKIVINHRLMLLGIKEQKETQKSIEAYKKILRYDIGLYVSHYTE